MPVGSSRSCSLLVVKNHHRDLSSQHHPRARVAESACQPFSRYRDPMANVGGKYLSFSLSAPTNMPPVSQQLTIPTVVGDSCSHTV
jgi:hypothetical protein